MSIANPTRTRVVESFAAVRKTDDCEVYAAWRVLGTGTVTLCVISTGVDDAPPPLRWIEPSDPPLTLERPVRAGDLRSAVTSLGWEPVERQAA
jgi:hypothetical protein